MGLIHMDLLHVFRPGLPQQRGNHAAAMSGGGLWDDSEDSEGPCSTVWPPRGDKRTIRTQNFSYSYKLSCDFFDSRVNAWMTNQRSWKEELLLLLFLLNLYRIMFHMWDKKSGFLCLKNKELISLNYLILPVRCDGTLLDSVKIQISTINTHYI